AEKRLEMSRQVAATDERLAFVFKHHHMDGSIRDRFDGYFGDGRAQAIAELASRFGIGRESAICDFGCGVGWLAYSLDKLGYRHLAAMDVSRNATQGLASIAGDRIDIINKLDEWRTIRHRFDALISVATIHHWHHIPLLSLEARRTLKPGG